MSWDILIQDFPKDAETVDDIPEDFEPKPLGDRADIVRRIREAVPEANFSDPAWGILEGGEYSIEFNMGSDEVCESIMLLVRGGGNVVPVITRLLKELDLRAIDCEAGAFFDPEVATASFQDWQEYRDQVTEK